ncbi:MAG: elongation factor P [Rickettsia endosymbiont of Haemaphysalis japonica]
MKISANSIITGNTLVYNNDLWVVSKTPEHTQPGKGGAYVQVEMKNLKTGTKRNERFSSSDYLEKAEFEQKDYQFLYFEGDDLVLMDTKHFDQINISKEMLEEKLSFLTENMIVKVEFYNDKPLNIELPPTVILEISETDLVIKGATATASYKPAILENGIKVKVPQYLEIGEKIVVKTDDMTYVERAK